MRASCGLFIYPRESIIFIDIGKAGGAMAFGSLFRIPYSRRCFINPQALGNSRIASGAGCKPKPMA